ncbi:hypothetical protein BH10ACT3_BH10ACT3_05250 [soil metagenome]
MQIRILGGFEVHHDGQLLELGGPKQRAVLGALVVDLGETVSSGRLVEIVWGDSPPAQADASLQAYISKLRKALEPDRAPRTEPAVLVTRPGGYALALPSETVDAERFRALVRRARESRLREDRNDALASYDQALQMWAPVLPEFEHDLFVVGLRLRLDDLYASAVEERGDVLLEMGQHRELIGEFEAAVNDEPLREHRWYQLALARYRSGQQTDALRAISRAREVLADQTGLDPGPELVRLESDMLAQSPSLSASAPTPRLVSPAAESSDRAGNIESDSNTDSGGGGGGGAESVPGAGSAATPFVGRLDEFDTMLGALDTAMAGHGRVVVVSGEPGIGKNRLTEEVARVAADRGVIVGWTRCPESAATETLRPIMQLGGVLLDQGLTNYLDLDEAAASAQDQDAGSARVDAVVNAVRDLSSSPRAFMAVVDDLQWADPSSLRVIEYSAANLQEVPVLLVVTVRPLDAGSSPALVECLGELARQPEAQRISLGGLAPEDVQTWITSRAAPGLAEFVHDRSGGNPFFVQELIALLAAEGRLDPSSPTARERAGTSPGVHPGLTPAAVPDAVADVIRRRVSRLPASTQQLLSTAAVVGRSFDADVTAAVSDRTTGELLDDLDPAIDAGLVIEDADVVGRFRFSHALVADALVAELSASRRARAHAAIAVALEDLRIGPLDRHLAEVAHHALAGALAGSAELAVTYSNLAADRAEKVAAYEDAAQHRSNALRALELARPKDRTGRYLALVQLGMARRKADDAAGAISAYADAIAVAEELSDVGAMADAAVLMNEPTPWQSGDYGSPNAAESAIVQRVLDRLPDDDSAARAELLGALSSFIFYVDPDRSGQLSLQAIEMARRLGEPTTLIRTLNNRVQSLWRASTRVEHARAVDELVEFAQDRLLAPDLQFLVEFTRLISGIERGESPRPHLERVRQLALNSGSSMALNQFGWFETALLSCEGRHADASALGAATYERYRRTRRWGADVIYFGSIVMTRIDSGQGEAMMAAATSLEVGEYAQSFVGFMAWSLQEMGLADVAREVLGAPGSAPDLRDDWLWLGGTTLTALAIAEAGDEAAAQILVARLAPHAGVISVAGTSTTLPSTDHALGLLYMLLGDTAAARRHLDRAIELEEAVGFVAWSTRARLARAQLLLQSDSPADLAAGRQELTMVRSAAERYQLIPVLARLEQTDSA